VVSGDGPAPEVVDRTARIGLFAKGSLYAVLGVLAWQLGGGEAGTDASQQGAMRSVAQQPFGTVVLGILAVGFLGYAGWRLLQAFRPPDGSSLPSWLLRAAMVARALVYGGFALLAGATVLGITVGEDGEQTLTAALLDLPGGVVVVVAAGLVVIGVGIAQLREAWTADFVSELHVPDPRMRSSVRVVGRLGHVGRGATFLVAGGFLVRAAIRAAPEEGVGLDAALQEVVQTPVGPWTLRAIAVGLLLYGGFCILQARYARTERVD
jgi:hypothetical protein